MEANQKTLADLRKRKAELDKAYWDEDNPAVSDEEYEAITKAIEEMTGEVDQEIRGAKKGGRKVALPVPLLSLDKVYTKEEIQTWMAKVARNPEEVFRIMPKYDGLSSLWTGDLLLTRGDGEVGEDITNRKGCIQVWKDVKLSDLDQRPTVDPKTLHAFEDLAVNTKGEILLRESNRNRLNLFQQTIKGKIYKNTRNALAGIIRQDKMHPDTPLVLEFWPHSCMTIEGTAEQLLFYWDKIVAHFKDLVVYKTGTTIEDGGLPMDGLVVSLVDEAYSDSLGATSHHPRGSMAFKFGNPQVRAKIKRLWLSPGRDQMTPMADIEPVYIDGITVTNASLSNLKKVKDQDFREGDIVLLERGGGVIPFVRYVLVHEEGSKPWEPPTACPSCGVNLVYEEPTLRCVNPNCKERIIAKMTCAVKNIGIERLGEPTIRKMAEMLGVWTLDAVFTLKREDILKLDKFKETSASNLLDEIDKARQPYDWQVLDALCIPLIGTTMSKNLLAVNSLDQITAWAHGETCPEGEMQGVEGFGDERWTSLAEGIQQNRALLERLRKDCGLTVRDSRSTGAPAPVGFPTICFTGKMPEKRSHYESLARANGFEPIDAYRKGLTVLVAADVSGNSTKLQKARASGTEVKSLDEWLATLKTQDGSLI